jgi:hypothetical protein
MAELSEARVGAVRRLIEQAPDGAIGMLETALAAGDQADRSIALVQTLISAEVLERRVRAAVFHPILPLCARRADGLGRLSFPVTAPNLAWRALKKAAPDMVVAAIEAFEVMLPDEGPPAIFDELCRYTAACLRKGADPFQPLADVLTGFDKNGVETFADIVALAPLARQALRRMPAWVRTLSSDHAAAIRLAFRDAVAISEDAAPPFLEILFAHLEEPYQVLRLISLVMDRPSDRYLASTELASFGERLLGDLERRIDDVRHFDATRGIEGGTALAASVHTATALIAEFEQWLALKREGPWGGRVNRGKRELALTVEARLREVESVINAALPLQPPRAKAVRAHPRLTTEPDPIAARKAQGLLAFVYETRNTASYGGFAALRAKVVDSVDQRLDHYAEDLLEVLHAHDATEAGRARAYLDIAAELLGLVRDPKAAEFIRRRAAVA